MQTLRELISGLVGVRGTLADLRAQREKLKRQREDLRALPPPRNELADAVCRWIDQRGRGYVAGLPAAFDFFLRHPEEVDQAKAGAAGGSSLYVPLVSAMSRGGYADREKMASASNVSLEVGLLYLLADPIKASIRKAIEKDMEYPEMVGPPKAQRVAELARLDEKIQKLDVQIEEIETELQALKGG